MHTTDLPTVLQWLATQQSTFARSIVAQSKTKTLSEKQVACITRMFNEAMEAASKPVLALVADIEALVTSPSPEMLAAIAATEADVNAAVAGDIQASVRACAALKAILLMAGGTAPEPEVDPRAADIELLAANMRLMTARDTSFATSLCEQYRNRGRLSDKQWFYVDRFVQQVRTLLAEAERLQVEAEAATLVASVRDRLIALTGSDTVSHSIRFCIPSLPGDPTGEPLFFGSIGWGKSNTGCEKHTGAPGDVRRIALGADRTKAIVEALMGLSDEGFLAVQGDYGRYMQTCGRCGAPLTDASSRAAGLGPDCASKAL